MASVRLSRTARVQKELRELATHFDANLPISAKRLRAAADELTRRTPVRDTGRRVAVKCTAEVRERIREYAAENPKMTFVEIGAVFSVNPGRVSESVAGFRE